MMTSHPRDVEPLCIQHCISHEAHKNVENIFRVYLYLGSTDRVIRWHYNIFRKCANLTYSHVSIPCQIIGLNRTAMKRHWLGSVFKSSRTSGSGSYIYIKVKWHYLNWISLKHGQLVLLTWEAIFWYPCACVFVYEADAVAVVHRVCQMFVSHFLEVKISQGVFIVSINHRSVDKHFNFDLHAPLPWWVLDSTGFEIAVYLWGIRYFLWAFPFSFHPGFY